MSEANFITLPIKCCPNVASPCRDVGSSTMICVGSYCHWKINKGPKKGEEL